MTAESFNHQLGVEFDHKLRLRWSLRRGTWQIERKTARASAPKRPVDSLDDEGIRYVEGYHLVMEVAPGDRAKCPKCSRGTHIPVMRMKEAVCEHCGRVFRAVYWPLSDSLLERLRYTDPDRDGIDRVFAEVDRAGEERERLSVRQRHHQTEAIWKDAKRQAFDSAGVGYTGNERMWQPLTRPSSPVRL